MNKYVINYEITTSSLTENSLEVQLLISNIKNKDLKLFKGKIKFLDFKCNALFSEDNHYYYIKNPNNTLIISYKVKIGTPGKHGIYGDLSNDLIVFAGEQILLLPIEALQCDSKKSSEIIDSIKINYNFSNDYTTIVPFKETNINTTYSICNSPKWSDIYELMKSSYVFGNFITSEYANSNNKLNIYLDSGLSNINNEILTEFHLLFDYYQKLFNYSSQSLSIISLRSNEDIGILGGCGRNIICSSFNKDYLRDWQLLSHRMFHSFMDTSLPLSDFHTPPTLWITEGLATYYENIALESLSINFKKYLNVNSQKEFTKLFNRYLYTSLKSPYIFSFPPMEEINISSAGKIEFLHYTQSPLIIKLIEDMSYNTEKRNVVITELLKLDLSTEFSLQDLFTNILGNEVNIFASKYLFNNELLPMWYLKDSSIENEAEILKDLNYYEYVLYTWMALEDNYYVKDELSSHNLLELSNIAEKNKIPFNSPVIEEQVKNYSLTIYNLLKQYALRAVICRVNYFDKDLRYKLLSDKNNLRIWETFINQYIS